MKKTLMAAALSLLVQAKLSLNSQKSMMSVKATVSGLLALTAFGLPLLLPLPASAQKPALIPGKQCVYNKAAFSVKVEWYDPGTIVYKGGDVNDKANYTILNGVRPIKTDNNVTAGLKSCTDAANRVAVVKIVGYNIVNSGIIIAVGTATGIATAVGATFACVGTVGAGCVALVAVGPATAGVIAVVDKALPEVKEVAYIGSPGTTKYVDISGSVWNVGIANNVPLTKTRGFKVVSDWVDGGEPGPKSITFNNQSGYVAEASVIYFQKQNIGGQIIPLPVVKSTGNLSLGFSRHIDIPVEVENSSIQVFIKGVGTIKKNVYSTTVPSNFSGNRCFKSFGTIFDAKGSTCK